MPIVELTHSALTRPYAQLWVPCVSSAVLYRKTAPLGRVAHPMRSRHAVSPTCIFRNVGGPGSTHRRITSEHHVRRLGQMDSVTMTLAGNTINRNVLICLSVGDGYRVLIRSHRIGLQWGYPGGAPAGDVQVQNAHNPAHDPSVCSPRRFKSPTPAPVSVGVCLINAQRWSHTS